MRDRGSAMKRWASALSLTLLLMSAALLASMMSVATVNASTTGQISIAGDVELASQAAENGWPGDGTWSNPYTISDIIISDPTNGQGITVSGTSKHLIIENCTISGTSSYAIDVTGASNVTVRDSAVGACFSAVFMYNSRNCTITNNTITSCQTGILLISSSDIMISGNTITDSLYEGIELCTSTSNNIAGNVVSSCGDHGLYLSSSDGNTIYGNTFIDNNGAGASYNTEHPQTYDRGVNAWSYDGQGNEWSDWSSEGPYPHEGSAAANDVLNTLDIGDTIPGILAIAVVVMAIVAAFVLIRRRRHEVQELPDQQAPPPQE